MLPLGWRNGRDGLEARMSMMPDADARLTKLIDAALAGARVVMEVYGTDFSVAHKVDDSPVSEADLGSEQAIAEILRAEMPGVPMVAEEEVSAQKRAEAGRSFLLVDPLDGTKEFISRNGEFTVNIALIEDEVPIKGVVLAPALGLAYAGSAIGAWKGEIAADLTRVVGWSPIKVRAAGANPVAVASRSHMNPATADALSQAACGEHRSIGSSLKFALLAEGEADFYPRLGPTMEWDTAAGDAILRAAGGAVVTLDDVPLRYGKVERRQDARLRKSVLPRRRRCRVGETARPRRIAFDPDGMSAAPLILTTKGLDDYRLLDSGHGRKLERFGALTLDRPEEQAIWTPRLAKEDWERADAVFTGDVDEEGAGRWRRRPGLAESWICQHGALSFICRFTSFRHVGAFPEQEAHWPFMRERLLAAKSTGTVPSLLNLFGYTGLASLFAAETGAEVTHVDASKKAIAWARENQALSKLDYRPIRWIVDDAQKFAAREARRGRRYDGVLLDPPKFGRGPRNEVWDLFRNLPDMLRLCRELLKPGGFLILTAYAIRASFLSLHRLSEELLGPGVEFGELALLDQSGGLLATSLFSRWIAP